MDVWKRVRDNPSLLVEGLKDPGATLLECNRIYYQQRYGSEFNRRGVDIFEDRDWDNLIILDACRRSDYADLTPFEQPVGGQLSRGSASKQFIWGNFHNKRLHDTVYVSGNQWYLRLHNEIGAEVHKYVDVRRDAVGKRVPSPGTLTDAALEYAEQFPNKRLLIHYMQPHRPFLGKNRELFTDDSGDGRVQLRDLRSMISSGEADRSDLCDAYRDNLRIVFKHVKRLVDELDGKTAISSDHGELLDERVTPFPVRWIGHPHSIYIDTLVNVPWQVVSDGSRRKITAEPPTDELDVSNAGDVEANLRNLGYL